LGGPTIIDAYEDVLSFDACRLLGNKEIKGIFLSHIDHKGYHASYQISHCAQLPLFFKERISLSQLNHIFQEKEIVFIDQLPLRYVTQSHKSTFTECMIKNRITQVYRIPLGKINQIRFFVFILLEADVSSRKSFLDLLETEKIKLHSKIMNFYHSLIKIRHLFLSYRKILELKGDETFPHMERVAIYSHEIAIQTWYLAHELSRNDILRKFTPLTLEALKLAATIHDIGKLAIPDIILSKPSKLTKEEFEIIKTHSVKGMEIISTAFPNTCSLQDDLFAPELSAIIEMTKKIIYQHHERIDGSGYPKGLKDQNIDLFSKIVSVADVFDAITSKRIYKTKQTSDLAVKEIVEDQFEKYDPLILEAFLRTQGKSRLQSLQ